jgi:hypothetical protein
VDLTGTAAAFAAAAGAGCLPASAPFLTAATAGCCFNSAGDCCFAVAGGGAGFAVVGAGDGFAGDAAGSWLAAVGAGSFFAAAARGCCFAVGNAGGFVADAGCFAAASCPANNGVAIITKTTAVANTLRLITASTKGFRPHPRRQGTFHGGTIRQGR